VPAESNRDVFQRFVDALNNGDMDAAAECFAEEACNFGRPVGRQGVRRVLKDIQATFPDIKLDMLDVLVDRDWVVERGTFSGTHGGMGRLPVNGGLLVGVPPTNRQFRVQHIHMFRISDGKIADHYANRDDIGMMQQLGLLPPSPPMPAASR
jgi:predicted ester cyclase